MKILLLVPKEGYSFVNQAQALAIGLTQLGIINRIIRVDQDDYPTSEIKNFNPQIIISIGSWHPYPLLIEEPQKMGFKVIPWLVSDGKINRFIDQYNQLDLILTPSAHCQRIFVRDGIRAKIIKVLPEAVDPDFWQPINEKELIPILKLISITKTEVNLPFYFDLVRVRREKIPVLFTTGGDATSKGAQEVIRALARIGYKDWLYLVKTWPSSGSFQRSALELDLAKKLGLLANIYYLVGQFSQELIRGLMNFCDIYIAPSRGEGFGLPLVEAQMCGKPVISLAANATQEVVKDKVTGFLARAETVQKEPRAKIDDLTGYLKLLLSDKSLRDKMGRQARIWAIDNFNPKVIAKRLLFLLA